MDDALQRATIRATSGGLSVSVEEARTLLGSSTTELSISLLT